MTVCERPADTVHFSIVLFTQHICIMKNTYCVTARYENSQQCDNHYYYPWSVLSAEFRVYHLTNLLQGAGLILVLERV